MFDLYGSDFFWPFIRSYVPIQWALEAVDHFWLCISGDELLSDSFLYNEIQNGALWEVQGKVGNYLFGKYQVLMLFSYNIFYWLLHCFNQISKYKMK